MNNDLEVAHRQSGSSSTWFLFELEFGNVGFWGEGKTVVPREKLLGAKERTNNKLNPHMASTPGSASSSSITCKFMWRLAREGVTELRREIRNVVTRDIGLPEETDLTNAGIYEHWTLKRQQLFNDAKQFKNRFNFSFCWYKNSVFWLRQQKDSLPVKIKDTCDLIIFA